jgi:WD40 repeat protein
MSRVESGCGRSSKAGALREDSTTLGTRGPWLSRDGSHLVVGREDQDVALCGLNPRDPGRLLKIPGRQTNHLRFSPDGQTLAASSHGSQEILLCDLESGRRQLTFRGHAASVMGLAFAADGRSLASLSLLDPVILVWDLATHRGACRPSPRCFPTHSGPKAACSPRRMAI